MTSVAKQKKTHLALALMLFTCLLVLNNEEVIRLINDQDKFKK